MNKVHRSVWNEITRTFVAVAEVVRSNRKSSKQAAVLSASQINPILLEQRFMFDGALVSALVDPNLQTATDVHVDTTQSDLSKAIAVAEVAAQPPSVVRTVDPALNNGRKEVAFVDTGVADYQTLVDGIRTGVEVVLLDAGQDGLAQMALWAQSHSGYDAIHVISHGAQGTIFLGSTEINQATLSNGQVDIELHTIGESLNAGGDLLLYGCSISEGGSGQTFVTTLAQLTSSDVAASTDATGSSVLGGDWVLETDIGAITTASVIDPSAVSKFNTLLAVPADQNFESSTTAGNSTNNITIGGVTYSTNGTGSPDVYDYLSFYLDPTQHLTGNVLVSDINSSANGTMTYVQFSNADGSNFKLNSLAANAWTTAAGFSQVFTITGYDGGSTSPVVVSVTGFDFQHSGTYGIGNAAITYTKDPDPNGNGYGVGLLTFGSAWDRIGTVRFTETDGHSAMLALDSLDFSPPTAASGPSVASINRAGASSALTNASSVAYTVTYSESVTGVDASDFVLTTTGTAGGTIASISGSGTTYTVTVNSLSGDGTLRLDLNNSGTGIVNGSAQAITGGFTSGQTYTLDTTAPTAPSGLDMTAGSDSGISNTDNITSVTTPTINGGGAEAGATVKLYDTDGTTLLGTTTADGSGNWSITTSALTDGAHTLKAKVTDAAGNTSTASTALSVTVDTTAPTAPSAPDMTSASDSGTSSGDNITSNNTPVFTGTAEANSTVKLYDTNGTTLLGTATADGSGNWSITSSTLSEGNHTLTVKATDTAGNTSVASSSLAVTIDRTAPTTTIASKIFSADTGSSNTDFITNTPAQTISGTLSANLAAGEVVYVSLDNGSTWAAATTSVGSNTWSLAGQTLSASNTLKIKVTDAAGNDGAVSSQAYTLDTTAPSAPSTPDMTSASDTGSSNTDNITSNTTPTFTGTAEAGSTVTLYDTDGTTVLGTATATGGNWSITSSALSSGNHTMTAKVTDAAGNVSSASAGLTTTVDAVAPSAVALSTTSLAETLATSGSTLATLSATDSSGLTYSLVAGAGDTNNDRFIIAGTDLKAGSSNLAAGTYDIRFRATDAAGNSFEQTFSITVTSGPSVASINRAGASSALTNASSVAYTVTYSESVTGVDASDFVLTTTGTAGGTIASISGSGTTYTVTVNSLSGDGTLRLDLNNSGTGIVNGSAQAITGGFTSGQTYTLDTTAPTAPSGLDMTAGSDSGISNTDNITSVTTPTINGGGAEAGATVKLYDTDGTTLLGTTTADGSGNWSITTSALTDGAHTLKAKVTDAAGNTSTASTALSVTVDTVAPTAIALNHTSVTEADTGTSSTIASLSSTDSNAVTCALVTGDGTNDANNSSFSISGTSLQTNAALSAGTYNIKVSATDAAGNVTYQSLTITVTNQQATQLVTQPPPQQPPRVEPTPQIKAVASPEVIASPTASSFFNQSNFGEKTAITIDSLLNSLTPVANDKVVETASRGVSIGVRSGSGEIFASGLSAINKLAEMEIPQGEASTISLPAGTFVHTDATARVSLSARLADGKPLPSYVKFNPTTGTFTVEASNRPPVDLQIRVIAVDDKGKTANTTVVIKIKGKSKSTSSIDVLPISGKMAFTEQLRNSEKPSGLMSHLAALNKAFEASNASRSHS
jgi:hypothetical protein